MKQVFIALGTNVDPRQTYIYQAIEELQAIGDIENCAPLYESEPYGVSGQAVFLNTAVSLGTFLMPFDLLKALKYIEKKIGRRHRYRWGPREIDLDIIFYGQEMIRSEYLQIPHYDYHNRCFVLQPLVDLAPTFIAPDTGETLSRMLKVCPGRSNLKVWNGLEIVI